jgi:hypothetical protein
VQNTVECSPSPFLEEIPGHLVHPFEEDKILSGAEVDALFARMREKLTAGDFREAAD